MEWSSSSGLVTAHQLQGGATAEKIEHEDGDVGENGELLESRAEREEGGDRAIDQNRDIRCVETPVNMRQRFWQETIAPEGEKNAWRAKNIADEEAERGNAGAGEQ